MKSISREASNRNITIWSKKKNIKNKQLKAVRYSNISFTQAYFTFKFKHELNFTQFYKYFEPIYKKPHRFFHFIFYYSFIYKLIFIKFSRNTDVCKYCKNAFNLKRELIKYAAEYEFIYENSTHFADNHQKTKYFKIDENDLNCKLMILHFEVKGIIFQANVK